MTPMVNKEIVKTTQQLAQEVLDATFRHSRELSEEFLSKADDETRALFYEGFLLGVPMCKIVFTGLNTIKVTHLTREEIAKEIKKRQSIQWSVCCG